MSTREYYYGYYVITLARAGEDATAISVCETFVLDFGYTEFNPYRPLVNEIKGGSAERKTALKNSLDSIKDNLDTTERALLDADYSKLI